MSDSHAFSVVKTHAFGNDFLLMAGEQAGAGMDAPTLARRLCDRHRGIGADGLILMTPNREGADTRLWNADGSLAEVSGNGVRCAAAWLARERRTAVGETLVVGTLAGPKRLTLLEVSAERFTFRADMGSPTEIREETIDIDGNSVSCVVLRVGNPQCVVLGPATESRLQTIAARLAVHPFFPEGTNVELVEVDRRDRLRILIWERGVGPTEASGTGACASAVAAAFAGQADRSVDVVSPGGIQRVEWADDRIWLTGWAEIIGRAEQWVRF